MKLFHCFKVWCLVLKANSVKQQQLNIADGWRRFAFLRYNCAGRV